MGSRALFFAAALSRVVRSSRSSNFCAPARIPGSVNRPQNPLQAGGAVVTATFGSPTGMTLPGDFFGMSSNWINFPQIVGNMTDAYPGQPWVVPLLSCELCARGRK